MKYKFLLLILITPLFSIAQTAKENAKAFVQAFMNQRYDTAITYIDKTLQGQVSSGMLSQIRSSLVQNYGTYKKVAEINHYSDNGFQEYYVYTEFSKKSIDIRTVFNNDNKIIGFTLVPHRVANSYKIKSGNLTIPGTLLIAGDNKKKLAIFVHGSGPNDRDETVGECKPFKDLAEGLQKAGISTYRYDKRTYLAPRSMPANPTVDDEVTNDVINIIHYFNQNDTFRNYKLYIIGHSLGGLMAPKIEQEAKGELSGIIMMAAPARPLEDILLEQLHYLDSITPTEKYQEALANSTRQVRYMHSSAFNQNSPADSLPLNQPASYWLSLKAYQPLKSIQNSSIPFFILQGEKDYKVRVTDFVLWKKAAKDKSNISFKSYPGLSHLFMKSNNLPGPENSKKESHIPNGVIKDIANWITENG